jgi:hypothetical protein
MMSNTTAAAAASVPSSLRCHHPLLLRMHGGAGCSSCSALLTISRRPWGHTRWWQHHSRCAQSPAATRQQCNLTCSCIFVPLTVDMQAWHVSIAYCCALLSVGFKPATAVQCNCILLAGHPPCLQDTISVGYSLCNALFLLFLLLFCPLCRC